MSKIVPINPPSKKQNFILSDEVNENVDPLSLNYTAAQTPQQKTGLHQINQEDFNNNNTGNQGNMIDMMCSSRKQEDLLVLNSSHDGNNSDQENYLENSIDQQQNKNIKEVEENESNDQKNTTQNKKFDLSLKTPEPQTNNQVQFLILNDDQNIENPSTNTNIIEEKIQENPSNKTNMSEENNENNQTQQNLNIITAPHTQNNLNETYQEQEQQVEEQQLSEQQDEQQSQVEQIQQQQEQTQQEEQQQEYQEQEQNTDELTSRLSQQQPSPQPAEPQQENNQNSEHSVQIQENQQNIEQSPEYLEEQAQKVNLIVKNIATVKFYTKMAIIYKTIFLIFGGILVLFQDCNILQTLLISFCVIDLFDYIYQFLQNANCSKLIRRIQNDHRLITSELYTQIYLQALKQDSSWIDIEEIILSKNLILFIMVEIYIIFYLLMFVVCIVQLLFYNTGEECGAHYKIYFYLHMIWGFYLTFLLTYLVLLVVFYPWYCLLKGVCSYFNNKKKEERNMVLLNNMKSEKFIDIKDNINSQECVICLGEYSDDEQVTILNCGQQQNNHHFHIDCLKEWLKTHLAMKCPVCRKSFEDQPLN